MKENHSSFKPDIKVIPVETGYLAKLTGPDNSDMHYVAGCPCCAVSGIDTFVPIAYGKTEEEALSALLNIVNIFVEHNYIIHCNNKVYNTGN